MNNDKLIVGLPKGKMQQAAYELISSVGSQYESPEFEESREYEKCGNNRKLIFEGKDIIYFLPKSADVPVYVDSGRADIGICGWDRLREYELQNATASGGLAGRNFVSDSIYYDKCQKTRFCIIGNPDMYGIYKQKLKDGFPIIVATEYPKIAGAYYAKTYPNSPIDTLRLSGSCELGILSEIADVAFDIVETGETIRQNELCIYEEVSENPVKFLSNTVAERKDDRISEIKDRIM